MFFCGEVKNKRATELSYIINLYIENEPGMKKEGYNGLDCCMQCLWCQLRYKICSFLLQVNFEQVLSNKGGITVINVLRPEFHS